MSVYNIEKQWTVYDIKEEYMALEKCIALKNVMQWKLIYCDIEVINKLSMTLGLKLVLDLTTPNIIINIHSQN